MHENAPFFIDCPRDVFQHIRRAAKTALDDDILNQGPQELFLGLRQVIHDPIKALEGPSHDGKVLGGKQMTGGQDQGQNLAQRQVAYGDHRVVENGEPPLASGKPEPHLGKLIPVVVKLSDGNAEVLGDLFGRLVWLGPDFNNDTEETCKTVTLHKKTIDFHRFKVKSKMR